MTLRKTKRHSKRRRAHSKRRRAHSKKHRRTYKIRGGGIAIPAKKDLIMYLRPNDIGEGNEGMITDINDNDGVMVNFIEIPSKRFSWKEWDDCVERYYFGIHNPKLVDRNEVIKNPNSPLPQIAFINVPKGTLWKAHQSSSIKSNNNNNKSGSRRHTSTNA